MLRQLIRSWLSGDRIRIAPEDGRLQRLQTGSTILLFAELYVVQQREIVSGPIGEHIRYVLSHDHQPAVLQANINHGGKRSEAELHRGDRVTSVFDSDVVVLPSVR